VKLCRWKRKLLQNCSKHWHVSAHYKCTFALCGSGTCFWVARVQQPFGFHHISTELRDVKHNGVVTALRHTAAEQNLVLIMHFCYWRVELQTNSCWHRSVSRVCLKWRDNYSMSDYNGEIWCCLQSCVSAVPRLRCLAAGISPRRIGFTSGSVHVESELDRWHWDRLFSGFFGISLSLSFYRDYKLGNIIWGVDNRPVDGRSSETWTITTRLRSLSFSYTHLHTHKT
jgi:hypothetical protein